MSNKFFVAVILFVVLIFGCKTEEISGGFPEKITVENLQETLNKDKSIILVDVREKDELAGPLGKLDGVVNIPMSQLEARYTEIPKDKPVILVCRSGNRSVKAQAFLKEKGYTLTCNLEGGMKAVREK